MGVNQPDFITRLCLLFSEIYFLFFVKVFDGFLKSKIPNSKTLIYINNKKSCN